MFYGRSWQGVTLEKFIQQIESYMVWYRDTQIKLYLGGLSPAEFKAKMGVCYLVQQNVRTPLSPKFDQPIPNLVWVCDFTYVRVGQRFCYLCIILDLFARELVAYRVSARLDWFLALDTLRDSVRS
mgnify:CR=1 FL=1